MSSGASPAPPSEDSAFSSMGSNVGHRNTNHYAKNYSKVTPRSTENDIENHNVATCNPTKTRPNACDLIVSQDDLAQAAKQMRISNVDLISQSLRMTMACFDELDLQRFDSKTEYMINFISNGPNNCSQLVLRPVSMIWPDNYDQMVTELARLDHFLLSTEFRERPVDWLLKRGLTTVPSCSQCQEKMLLAQHNNNIRWLCNKTQTCQNYSMPVLRPSFFSGYENVGLDKLLFLVYYWASCTPAQNLHDLMKVELTTLNNIWKRMQNVCRTALEKAYPRHRLTNVLITDPNLDVDTAEPIDLISIKVNNIFVVCAKNPCSNLVRLGLYIPQVSSYSFVDLTESWFAHGAHIRISEQKFVNLSKRRTDLRLDWVSRMDMVSKNGQFYNNSAFGYIVNQLTNVLKDFKSSSLTTEQLKLVLAEMQWRELYGTNPFDAFTNIVRHISEYGDQSDYYVEPTLIIDELQNMNDPSMQDLTSDNTNYVYAESYFYGAVEPVGIDGKTIRTFTMPPCEQNPPPADIRVTCHLCNMVFETFEFSLHIITHVEINRRENERREYLEKNLIECKHCFKLFARDQINMHLTIFRMELQMVQYGCRICCIRLPDRQLYLEHLRSAHFEQETPYRCPSCDFASSIQRELFIHFQEEHRHSMILLCPLCLKSFTVVKPESLNRVKMVKLSMIVYNHIAQHYILSKKFTCSNCCLCFINKEKLLRHKRLHHNPLEQRLSSEKYKQVPYTVSDNERDNCVKAHRMELFIANKRPNLAVNQAGEANAAPGDADSDDERIMVTSKEGLSSLAATSHSSQGPVCNRDGPSSDELGINAPDEETVLVRGASNFLDGGCGSLQVKKPSETRRAEPKSKLEPLSSEGIIKMMSRLERSDAIVANKSVILTPAGLAATCCECREPITTDHFVAQLKCLPKLRCPFKTYCPRAATKHRREVHDCVGQQPGAQMDVDESQDDEQPEPSESGDSSEPNPDKATPSSSDSNSNSKPSKDRTTEIEVVTIDDSSSQSGDSAEPISSPKHPAVVAPG